MVVRTLQKEEISEALSLARRVFNEEVKNTYEETGIRAFYEYTDVDRMESLRETGRVELYGAFEETTMCGMLAIHNNGHISLFFVEKGQQNRGVGKELLKCAYHYTAVERGLMRMTFNAPVNAKNIFLQMGFRQIMEEQLRSGVRFIPMQYLIHPNDIVVREDRRRPMRAIVAIILAALVFLVPVASEVYYILSGYYGTGTTESGSAQVTPASPEENQEQPSGGENAQIQTPEAGSGGIDTIACHVEENLPYEVKEEVYEDTVDGKNGQKLAAFSVKYPQISGLDSEVQEIINENLKDCAMSTADALYLNPNVSVKEAILQKNAPALSSKVEYRITYQSAEFISVVFTDHYCSGDPDQSFLCLKTRNIRLSDGKQLELTDIVEINNDFISAWLPKMKQESGNNPILGELKTSEMKRILYGDLVNDTCYRNFFVAENAVEIGFSYQSKTTSQVTSGWITAPFTEPELQPFMTDSDFWNMIHCSIDEI